MLKNDMVAAEGGKDLGPSPPANPGKAPYSSDSLPPLEDMDVDQLCEVLCDGNAVIGRRMRTVFFLRTNGSLEAVAALCKCLKLKGHSSLLRHEIGYCLGQMQNIVAVPDLITVLSDQDECPVVRHESAEALAAIGDVTRALPVLETHCKDAHSEVSETCKIAVKQLRWLQEQNKKPLADKLFNSVDPAMPFVGDNTRDVESMGVEELTQTMLNPDLALFTRYQTMFALRNRGGAKAVKGLCLGFQDKSALFRHEVAFILGQMAHPDSFAALKESLVDANEHAMVRHESAEAIGAIVESLEDTSVAPSRGECVALLRQYLADPEPLVSESCITALDSIEYWESFALAGGEVK